MGAKLTGDKELIQNLHTLGERVQRKVMRQSVNAGLNPVLKSARAKAPEESGLTKEAMDKRVKTYTDTQTVVGLVGPNTKVQGEYDGKIRKPSKYSHLVESGHIDRAGNFVPGKHFMAAAFAENEQAMVDTMKSKMGKAIEKEAAKQ